MPPTQLVGLSTMSASLLPLLTRSLILLLLPLFRDPPGLVISVGYLGV